MVECFKTLMLCLNRIGCPKDIKGLIKNIIVEKIVRITEYDDKEEWFELFGEMNGLYRVWYSNGQLWSECMYKDGKKNGICREWHSNGRLRKETMFKDGERNGLCRSWYENGQLWYEFMYKDGKKNGLYCEWSKNGQLEIEIMYKDWKENGSYRIWPKMVDYAMNICSKMERRLKF